MNAVTYARINDRVETNDTSAVNNLSVLTLLDLGYADDNAIVICQNASLLGGIRSTIQIGESALITKTFRYTLVLYKHSNTLNREGITENIHSKK